MLLHDSTARPIRVLHLLGRPDIELTGENFIYLVYGGSGNEYAVALLVGAPRLSRNVMRGSGLEHRVRDHEYRDTP